MCEVTKSVIKVTLKHDFELWLYCTIYLFVSVLLFSLFLEVYFYKCEDGNVKIVNVNF